MPNNLRSNSQSVPLVLVQLGSIPKYLKSNLRYLDATFPERRKVLISDIESELWLSKLSFDLVNPDSLISEWPQHFMVSDRRQYFRNNFWFSTKARLMLLPKFMKQEGLERILHLENDVWLHPKFPFSFFEHLNYPLAFPRVDNARGIASTLFIQGEEGVEILERACRVWASSSDMQILGNILNSNAKVLELASTNALDKVSPNSWIFDGAKLGMYLFGSDPRNSKGLIKRFSQSLMGDLEIHQKMFLEAGELVLGNRKDKYRIASLHIHSKDKRIFSVNWESTLKSQLRKMHFKVSYGFSWVALLKSISEMTGRVVRKVKFLI
jgi:hypothetical protein